MLSASQCTGRVAIPLENTITISNVQSVESVYNDHPWDQQKWLLYRGNRVADHFTQVTIKHRFHSQG